MFAVFSPGFDSYVVTEEQWLTDYQRLLGGGAGTCLARKEDDDECYYFVYFLTCWEFGLFFPLIIVKKVALDEVVQIISLGLSGWFLHIQKQ